MSALKLWKLSQSMNNGYDTYDSCIVAAYTEEEAKNISPCRKDMVYMCWTINVTKVTATCIGVASPSINSGTCLLASFNAG